MVLTGSAYSPFPNLSTPVAIQRPNSSFIGVPVDFTAETLISLKSPSVGMSPILRIQICLGSPHHNGTNKLPTDKQDTLSSPSPVPSVPLGHRLPPYRAQESILVHRLTVRDPQSPIPRSRHVAHPLHLHARPVRHSSHPFRSAWPPTTLIPWSHRPDPIQRRRHGSAPGSAQIAASIVNATPSRRRRRYLSQLWPVCSTHTAQSSPNTQLHGSAHHTRRTPRTSQYRPRH